MTEHIGLAPCTCRASGLCRVCLWWRWREVQPTGPAESSSDEDEDDLADPTLAVNK